MRTTRARMADKHWTYTLHTQHKQQHWNVYIIVNMQPYTYHDTRSSAMIRSATKPRTHTLQLWQNCVVLLAMNAMRKSCTHNFLRSKWADYSLICYVFLVRLCGFAGVAGALMAHTHTHDKDTTHSHTDTHTQTTRAHALAEDNETKARTQWWRWCVV